MQNISTLFEEINLIVITPHGRSGSVLVQSLLDGHPQIIGFPTINFSYEIPLVLENPMVFLRDFIANHPDMLDTKSGYFSQTVNSLKLNDKNSAFPAIEDETFFKAAETILSEFPKTLTRKEFVVAIHLALGKVQGVELSRIKYILIHLHTYNSNWDDIIIDFPQLYFLATLRDPRESWLAWHRVLQSRVNPLDLRIFHKCYRKLHVDELQDCYELLISKTALLKDRHLLPIDLNILHAKSNISMVYISDFLKIDFNESLLQSTIMNVNWYGNSSEKKLISGLVQSQAQTKWKNELPEFDIKYVEFRLEKFMKMFGYPVGSSSFNSRIFPKIRSIQKYELHLFCKIRLVIGDTCNFMYFNRAYLNILPVFFRKFLYLVFRLTKGIIKYFNFGSSICKRKQLIPYEKFAFYRHFLP